MRLNEIVAWYQKKIGTYDKQQWEKTVEQKILDGFSSVNLKTAKLKTELIDVDLVRGSTFPKAKSKQSLLTVIRLAILRYLFLPVYTKWWVKQTSPNIFGLLLCLYVTQMTNWAVYTFNINRLEHNEAAAAEETVKEHIVSLSELLIPMGLSFLLSLIHSQIVATNTASGCKSKCRRFSNTSQSGKQQRAGEAKVRRRRKLVKIRSQDFVDGATYQRKTSSSNKKFHSGVEVSTKVYKSVPCESKSTTEDAIDQRQNECSSSAIGVAPCTTKSTSATCHIETFHSTSTVVRKSHNSHALPSPPPCPSTKPCHFDLNNSAISTEMATPADCTTDNHKKRNVNWHFPIQNYATESQPQTQKQDRHQQTSPQTLSSTTACSELNAPKGTVESDGCSNYGRVPDSIASGSATKIVRIDECVQEFYNDLINRTADSGGAVIGNVANRDVFMPRRNVGDDDGFESLNGKSSSGEETMNFLLPLTAAGQTAKSQLRLRLNVTDAECQSTSLTAIGYRRKVPLSSESEDNKRPNRPPPPPSCCDAYQQTNLKSKTCASDGSSGETEEEGDDGKTVSSPASVTNNSNYNECTTSATEWLGVTTNSEECSYSSELENSDNYKNTQLSDEDGYDVDFTPTTILNPHSTSDRISCTFWDQREFKKAQMSVLEISSCIIDRVESMPETKDYIYIGVCFSFLLSLIPPFCRLCEATIDSDKSTEINFFDVPMILWEKASFSFSTILHMAFGKAQWERTVLVICCVQRVCLTTILFIIFVVAERTFKQRFLYAKLFSHLTSSRRARKSNLPHFRLNKVRNIKTWLSVRSYLKKRGPQRSVDVIVSAAFIITFLLLAFLSVEWLKDSVRLHSHLNLEALLWSTTIGIFLLRFMTLGNKIHHKYRSVSVLITEQINLYLQIEQKPKKKDELMVSNSVLKLAADLLKELETPFKISGLSANPYLFTTIKVVILSALSGVLSEMLGFKLKLHKIKIK